MKCKNWNSCQTLDSQGWANIRKTGSQEGSEGSGWHPFSPPPWLIMGPSCFSASFPLVEPGPFECTCFSFVSPCLVKVAVVRGREHFLIVVLWPKPHVKTLGGLTQMRWGPDDCSAALRGRLGYSFWVVVWSVFEFGNFRSLVLLFKKDEGRHEWGEVEFYLPLILPPPPIIFNLLLPTKLNTLETHSKWPHWTQKRRKTRETKTTVKAINYRHTPGWVASSATKWIFLETPTSQSKKGCFICKDTGTCPI